MTDQFLTYVRQLGEVQADTLADFLKWRPGWCGSNRACCCPGRPASKRMPEEDPAEALARQLREYKRFKEAAGACAPSRRPATTPTCARRAARTGAPSEAAALGARRSPGRRAGRARRRYRRLPPESLTGMVVPFTMTIHDQIGLIRRTTAAGRTVTFRSLLAHAQRRTEIIVTLLAVLELIKRNQITVSQDEMFGEIILVPVADAPENGEEAEDGEP